MKNLDKKIYKKELEKIYIKQEEKNDIKLNEIIKIKDIKQGSKKLLLEISLTILKVFLIFVIIYIVLILMSKLFINYLK